MKRIGAAATVGLTALLVSMAALALVISLLSGTDSDLDPVSNVVYLCDPFALALLGCALTLRLPRHWSGWLMLVIALAMVFSSLPESVLAAQENDEHWADGLAPTAAWLENWTWTVMFAGLLFVVLKFAGTGDDGRRWRRAGWCGMACLLPLAIVWMSAAAEKPDGHAVEPTIISGGIDEHTADVIMGPLFLGVLAGLVCAVVALVIRYRASAGAERAQLRWVLWAFSVLVVALLVSIIVQAIADAVGERHSPLVVSIAVLQQLAVYALPVGLYIAVSRHGLFEIDRVISRSVSYSALLAVLTAVYVGIVTGTTRLLPDDLGSLPVAAATLIVAAAFAPARRWVIGRIDRRFNRARYDAEQITAAFAEQTRLESSADPHATKLLAAVQQVFQPSIATVWIAPRSRRTPGR